MMHFGSMGELARHLMDDVSALPGSQRGLARAASLLKREMKKEFGRYQDGIGPFEDWPELADATKEDRVAQGYSENEPLLREGDLRDSIESDVAKDEATIGSTSDIMPYHEFGTSTIPPRPVIGIALYRNAGKVAKLVGDYAVRGMIGISDGYGVDDIHRSLGYSLNQSRDQGDHEQ